MIIKSNYEIQEEFIDHIGSGNDTCAIGTDLRKTYNGMELVEHVPREYKCRPHHETSGRYGKAWTEGSGIRIHQY